MVSEGTEYGSWIRVRIIYDVAASVGRRAAVLDAGLCESSVADNVSEFTHLF
jgi:hypothetical protein